MLLLLAQYLEVCASSGSAVCYGQDKMACHLHPILCTCVNKPCNQPKNAIQVKPHYMDIIFAYHPVAKFQTFVVLPVDVSST